MTETMVIAICAASAFIVYALGATWLFNRREERDAERLYFKETGILPERFLKGD